jgi:hypothetical protein
MAKNILANKPEGVEYKLVCIGDKSKVGYLMKFNRQFPIIKAIMQRIYAKDFLYTANEIGRTPPTFQDASIAGIKF